MSTQGAPLSDAAIRAALLANAGRAPLSESEIHEALIAHARAVAGYYDSVYYMLDNQGEPGVISDMLGRQNGVVNGRVSLLLLLLRHRCFDEPTFNRFVQELEGYADIARNIAEESSTCGVVYIDLDVGALPRTPSIAEKITALRSDLRAAEKKLLVFFFPTAGAEQS